MARTLTLVHGDGRASVYRYTPNGIVEEAAPPGQTIYPVVWDLLEACCYHLESICLGDPRMEIVMEWERLAKRTICRGEDPERLAQYILARDDLMSDLHHIRPDDAWREIESFVWSMALQPPRGET